MLAAAVEILWKTQTFPTRIPNTTTTTSRSSHAATILTHGVQYLIVATDDLGVSSTEGTFDAPFDIMVGGECMLNTDCDDNNVCTNDMCNFGFCEREVLSCDDGDPCNGVEFCDSLLGCLLGPPPTEVCSGLLDEDCDGDTDCDDEDCLGNVSCIPGVFPPGMRMTVGTIDPNLPTIVITHGLQDGLDEEEEINPLALWTGFSTDEDEFDPVGAGHILQGLLGNEVNIIQFVWEEAYQGLLGYSEAYQYTYDAGVALATQLISHLNASSYDQKIHFIGHSLGTVVNAYAARFFLSVAPNVATSQVTILDYPNRSPLTPPVAPQFFAVQLQNLQIAHGLRMDNYYSPNVWVFRRICG